MFPKYYQDLGGIDDEALKNAKVDIAEKMEKETPKDLDPDVAAALAGTPEDLEVHNS